MAREVKDALLKKTVALPAAASSTVYTASINLGTGDKVAGMDILITAPALDTTALPDTRTVTYTVQASTDNSSFSAASAVGTLTQTGASTAGAAATTLRVALPSNAAQYIRLAITTGGSTGDCSGVSGSVEVLL